jgi:hypothetical protein
MSDFKNLEYKLVLQDLWLDANQGTDVDDKAFGFVGTDEYYEDHNGDDLTYCGWFFTWPTQRAKITSEAERQAVIDSLEIDETERHKKEIPHELVVKKLEAYLAKKFPGDLDDEGE